MRLIDLPRTGSFRLALLFLALFGVASAALFGFLFLETQRFQVANIDDWLIREASSPASLPLPSLRRQFDNHAASAAGNLDRVFVLYGPTGAWEAGDRVPRPTPFLPLDRPSFFTLATPGGIIRYRGIAHLYDSGQTAIIAQNMYASSEFDEAFVRTVLAGGLLTALLGLGGAAIVGIGSVRRFDAAAVAIQDIVRGDLSRRLPAGGTSSDLDRLTGVVNGMLDEIERLMSEVKGVCDGIAHDLRTPLTRVVAGLERAQRRAGTTEEYALAIDDAVDELRGLQRTFTAMLRIAEIEDGARRSGFVDVDLVAIAHDILDFYEPAAEDKDIALSLDQEPASTLVMKGDAGLLFSAVSNLVGNAIKFTPPGGRVIVGLHRRSDETAILVSDTGCGIPAGEREAVLRRFYRSEQSRQSPGNGLGLALVSAVARLHDMSVEIETLDPGTRVALRRTGLSAPNPA